MTHFTQKLKKYHSINKGVVKSLKLNSGATLKLAASIPVLVLASYSSLSAQCEDDILTNSLIPLNGGPGGGLAFDVNNADGPGNDFSIFENNATLGVRLNILNPNLSVLRVAASTDNLASALRNNGTATSGAGNFVSIGNNDLFLNYGINASNGQFQDGHTEGHVIFKNNVTGFVGYFTLQYDYVNGANEHRATISEGALNTASGNITPGDCTSLPVELVKFEAMAQADHILLDWATETEVDNAGFEIQRSDDGSNFKTISFVEGKGNSFSLVEYSLQDTEVKAGTLYYYRLKQIDFNGQSDFSEVKTAKLLSDKTTVSEIYPNPNRDGSINVDFDVLDRGTWQINLFDNAGTMLSTDQRIIESGSSTQSFSFDNLASGLYIIKFDNGSDRFYKKISITK